MWIRGSDWKLQLSESSRSSLAEVKGLFTEGGDRVYTRQKMAK